MSRNPLWKNWWPAGYLDTIFLKTGGRVHDIPDTLSCSISISRTWSCRVTVQVEPPHPALLSEVILSHLVLMHQDPYRRERTYGYVGLATARRSCVFFLCVFFLEGTKGCWTKDVNSSEKPTKIEPLRQHLDIAAKKWNVGRRQSRNGWCVPKALHSLIFLY